MEYQNPTGGSEPEHRPALVINIFSWATPVVALLALVAGMALGYFGRPFIARDGSELASNSPVAVPQSATSQPQTESPAVTGGTGQQSAEDVMATLVSQVRHFKGDPQAPVTLIEFSDFKCPYCGRHATGAGRQIITEYVDTGLVRVAYWHMAFLSPESQSAAEASECAAEQDKFWEYHEVLFENQASFSDANLKSFAQQVGLDMQTFNECLDSGRHRQTVTTDTTRARSLGVSSTPAFLINGQPMLGAQPFESFQQVIELKLAEAGR